MSKEAVILAGGFGTRLQSVLTDVPKPMAKIGNLPFLSYLFEQLFKFNFEKIVLAVGYRYEAIESYFGDTYKNIHIEYSIEKEPLGTGGAITAASGFIDDEHFFVLNGDTFFEVDLNRMEEKYLHSTSGLMVALKPLINFNRYGAVITSGEKIISFNEKKFCRKGLINGGVYIVNRDWLNKKAVSTIFSFEKDILEKEVSTDTITYYISDSYFIDIGIPEDYIRASEELPYLLK